MPLFREPIQPITEVPKTGRAADHQAPATRRKRGTTRSILTGFARGKPPKDAIADCPAPIAIVTSNAIQ
jgi:hypothetical protein